MRSQTSRLLPAGAQQLLAFVLVILVLGFPRSAFAADQDYAPILPGMRAAVRAETEGKVSTYDFNLRLDEAGNTISGTERVNFVNTTGEPQETVYFRLYPNAGYYGEGDLTIERARVAGKIVSTTLTEQNTVLALPLPAPLANGDHIAIALRFTVTVPADSNGTYGIFSRVTARNMWVLADWYPILAGWEPGHGWRLDPPSPFGDPTFSDIGIYDLSLNLPANLTLAATGTQQARPVENGRAQWTIASGPVREMTLVIDDDFTTTSQTVDGVKITFYRDGTGADASVKIVLDTAAKVLDLYSATYGRYPYSELDLIETPMSGALGISWTGLVFLNADTVLNNTYYTQTAPERLRFTVAHEVGHQWWGAVVGINSNDFTYLLEGLTNYLAIAATERIDGAQAARDELQVQCVQPYLNALTQYGDGIANLPGTQVISGPPRGAIIYGKAALGFLAIRERIGDTAFFDALHNWAADNAFALGTPEELLAAFNKAAATDISDLWRFWFDEAQTTADDVNALLTN